MHFNWKTDLIGKNRKVYLSVSKTFAKAGKIHKSCKLRYLKI
jgi:hypothetical protein